MQLQNGQLVFSPSDLNGFLECEHLTTLDIQRSRGGFTVAEPDDAEAELRQQLGLRHEAGWRTRFRDEGKTVIDIPSPYCEPEGWLSAADATRAAMRDGADVIYQAVLIDGNWRGIADFVVRTDEASALGSWSYEAWDTKLGRHAKPTYALQLAFYTEQIGQLQGRVPPWMRVVLGHNQVERLRTQDFLAYYRAARSRFTAFAAEPDETAPYPVEHCSVCRYGAYCADTWRTQDHLSLVAGMRRETAHRLERAGVKSVAALANAADRPDPRIGVSSFLALREQARLQRSFVESGQHSYRLIPPSDDRGFALLPPPSAGDLFFDMEGYPYFEPTGGLEYLFGVAWADGGAARFRPWWGTDRAQERAAFEGFIDFVRGRLREDPNLHVYHYASYERTKLGHLAQQHSTREEELDDLLRRQIFVDLYKVTRQSLRTSHEGYSLKDVRQFFASPSAGTDDPDVATAGDSIVAFSKWMLSKDQAILDAIATYNEEDCVSTLRLRDWLIERRAEAVERFGVEIPWRAAPSHAQQPVTDPVDENAELRASLERSPVPEPEAGARRLLAGLLDYHRREDKPEWWEYFARFEASLQELIDDPGAIVGLAPAGAPVPPVKPARMWTYPLEYPDQEHGFDVGDKPDDLETGKSAGTITAGNHDHRRLDLSYSQAPDARPLPKVVVAAKPLDSKAQREAVRRVAVYFDGTGFGSGADYRAVGDLLLRRAPRLRAPSAAGAIQTRDLAAQQALVASLDRSALVIQGPPGSGKTWLGARLIASLLDAGASVGVSALSHRAIHNLLGELERVAEEAGIQFAGVKKASAGRPDSFFQGRFITSETDSKKCQASQAQLLAGTPFFFPYLQAEAVDYLFIDEAGQLSLGDAIAVGACAKNLVLLGYSQQLPHVTHGVHPAGAEASALEHYLNGQSTVPPDRGLFLSTTYRMHPNVCDFVSRLSYDGRLIADRRAVTNA